MVRHPDGDLVFGKLRRVIYAAMSAILLRLGSGKLIVGISPSVNPAAVDVVNRKLGKRHARLGIRVCGAIVFDFVVSAVE